MNVGFGHATIAVDTQIFLMGILLLVPSFNARRLLTTFMAVPG